MLVRIFGRPGWFGFNFSWFTASQCMPRFIFRWRWYRYAWTLLQLGHSHHDLFLIYIELWFIWVCFASACYFFGLRLYVIYFYSLRAWLFAHIRLTILVYEYNSMFLTCMDIQYFFVFLWVLSSLNPSAVWCVSLACSLCIFSSCQLPLGFLDASVHIMLSRSCSSPCDWVIEFFFSGKSSLCCSVKFKSLCNF